MKRILALLFALSLIVRALTAMTLANPGYFDAFYYYHLAQNMAAGAGITENLIWNYLDNPDTLPRPGAQYWMPMTAFLAWLGMTTFRFLDSWRAAQMPFVLLSALLPPLSAWIAWRAWGNRGWAIVAGLLTLFSGYYFVYWVIPDNFLPFALATSICFLALARATDTRQPHSATRAWLVAGLGAGLSHLARVDGLLLVPLVAGFWLFGRERAGRYALAAAAGYLIVMLPWWIRNILVAGTPLPGGGIQTLWLTSYEELFTYDPVLTPARYLEWGWQNISLSKLQSAWGSLLVVLGVTLFYMAPCVLVAVRTAYRLPLFRPVLWYSVLLLTTMPLLFTFPAIRGSLLHSSAALVVWYMAMVPYGLACIVAFIAARRHTWNAAQATTVFSIGFVFLAILLTIGSFAQSVWLSPPPDAAQARWNERTIPYAEVGAWLDINAAPDARIFVNEPPLFTVVTGHPSLVIPPDGLETLARAARDWQADYLLMESAYEPYYPTLYSAGASAGGWHQVATFADGLEKPVYLFRYEE